jgi:hypothetical protein
VFNWLNLQFEKNIWKQFSFRLCVFPIVFFIPFNFSSLVFCANWSSPSFHIKIVKICFCCEYREKNVWNWYATERHKAREKENRFCHYILCLAYWILMELWKVKLIRFLFHTTIIVWSFDTFIFLYFNRIPQA